MPRTPSLDHVLPKLQRIARMAQEAPQMAFTTLAHHIDVELLHAAYRRTRKDGAVGVDGQTAAAFEENLEGNLQALVDRMKSGTYFAPPVRRVHIPKGDGRTRPIGIPTFTSGTSAMSTSPSSSRKRDGARSISGSCGPTASFCTC